MEIERKFLITALPSEWHDVSPSEIEQGYLCTAPVVRVRKVDDSYVLTVKERRSSAANILCNREEEFALTAETYARMLAKCDGRTIRKSRYRIPLADGLTAEVDIFHGRHEGLQLVEVEFRTEAQAKAFVAPDWFAAEVTDDPRYRNCNMI
ncbi:MAG: CYTH domain-containing protein [Bacteroidales bacterium]|nr:CYTH domain-containing protein [Bacteroidales bacterium]